jgi:hypothetical protein
MTTPLFGRNLMRPCDCEEVKLTGFVRRTIRGRVEPLAPRTGWNTAHDCRYVAERNACIPEAERLADAAVAGRIGGLLSTDMEWSRVFHESMDALMRRSRLC